MYIQISQTIIKYLYNYNEKHILHFVYENALNIFLHNKYLFLFSTCIKCQC